MWFNAEGEQRLKDSYATDDTLVYNEKTMQHFDLFLAQSKVLQRSSKRGLKIRVFPYLTLSVSLHILTVCLYFLKVANI